MKQTSTVQAGYMISALILFSLAVTWIDAVVQPPYLRKIPIKIACFLLLPLLYFLIWRGELVGFKKILQLKCKGFFLSLLLGIGLYVVIAGGYFLTRSFFDYSAVTKNLTSEMGITADNFLYTAIYITVINSFLEEFFFRGFGFMTLKNQIDPQRACLLSSVLFTIYHIGMTARSYPPLLLLVMMTGLTLGGMVFCWLNRRFGSLYPAWFVHMAADAGIMTVGADLFRIFS